MVWKTVEPTRVFAYIEDFQVAGVYQDSTGSITAWVWPLGEAAKRFLGHFVTVRRAVEAVEDAIV